MPSFCPGFHRQGDRVVGYVRSVSSTVVAHGSVTRQVARKSMGTAWDPGPAPPGPTRLDGERPRPVVSAALRSVAGVVQPAAKPGEMPALSRDGDAPARG